MFNIYITNLGKYNEGELVGKWLSLPCDDIESELNSIGVKDGTRYEEYFITDYENDFDYSVGEYENLEKLNELAEKLENLDDYQKEWLKAYKEAYSDDLEYCIENFENESIFYQDCTIKDVAQNMVDNGYFGDIPDDIAMYIDYDAIARDLSCKNFVEVSNGTIEIL